VATFRLEIVTAERMILPADVSEVVAWGMEGQLGILPHHAPLMTMLQPGDLVIRKENEEEYLAISGGFLEVRPEVGLLYSLGRVFFFYKVHTSI
jgi:F-type H+-transporting ATPase subunit epsilon